MKRSYLTCPAAYGEDAVTFLLRKLGGRQVLTWVSGERLAIDDGQVRVVRRRCLLKLTECQCDLIGLEVPDFRARCCRVRMKNGEGDRTCHKLVQMKTIMVVSDLGCTTERLEADRLSHISASVFLAHILSGTSTHRL